jgi:hypothetical protein
MLEIMGLPLATADATEINDFAEALLKVALRYAPTHNPDPEAD